MSKKLLLINDMAGYGKVALSAMIPVLSHMKYEVFNLPTAIVSNTLDYGKFDILDTTDYMKNAIAVWEQLGFEFDAISTGFIVSKEQTQLVTEFCKARAEKGVTIFTDPIMEARSDMPPQYSSVRYSPQPKSAHASNQSSPL